jgi:Putative auto-transporter adhesin, head GIN domain
LKLAAPSPVRRSPVQSRSDITAPPRPPARSTFARSASLATLALAAAVAGCEPYVEGNGKLGEQARDVSAFVGLEISDGIQAIVAVGAAGRSVRVEGDENVLDHVETSVQVRFPYGPALVVSVSSGYQSVHPLQVYVEVPAFGYVAASAASPVTVTGASADQFTVVASDGSIVSLAGAGGTRLAITLGGGEHGGARLDARDYPVQQADVSVSGGAVAAVDAAAAVQGSAAGAGTRLENTGDGACAVTTSGGAEVVCAGP